MMLHELLLSSRSYRRFHQDHLLDENLLKDLVQLTRLCPSAAIGGLQGSFQGHFWAYLGYEHPYSVYDFTKSHARDGPARFLQEIHGLSPRGYFHRL